MTTATSTTTTTTTTTLTGTVRALTTAPAVTGTALSRGGGACDDGGDRGTAPAGRALLGVLAVPMALLAALAGWVDHDADGV